MTTDNKPKDPNSQYSMYFEAPIPSASMLPIPASWVLPPHDDRKPLTVLDLLDTIGINEKISEAILFNPPWSELRAPITRLDYNRIVEVPCDVHSKSKHKHPSCSDHKTTTTTTTTISLSPSPPPPVKFEPRQENNYMYMPNELPDGMYTVYSVTPLVIYQNPVFNNLLFSSSSSSSKDNKDNKEKDSCVSCNKNNSDDINTANLKRLLKGKNGLLRARKQSKPPPPQRNPKVTSAKKKKKPRLQQEEEEEKKEEEEEEDEKKKTRKVSKHRTSHKIPKDS